MNTESFLETEEIGRNIWQAVVDGEITAEEATEILDAILDLKGVKR